MRVLSLLLCFILSLTMTFGQVKEVEKKEIKKEIIIIKSEGDTDEEVLIEELKAIEGKEDIEKIIQKYTKEEQDSVDVDVEVTVENGTTIRKYVIKTMVDGKEEVREIVEKVSDEKDKMIRKKVIVIDSEDGDISKDELKQELMKLQEEEDIEVFVKEMEGNTGDSVRVNVEVNDMGVGGKRKIVIKTIKDGKEEIKEIIEDTEEGENTFVWTMENEEESMPMPKVSMGVLIAEGTIIEKVVEGSSAAEAGLEKGDKLIKIDQQVIYSVNGLLEHLSSFSENDKAVVTFERDGKVMSKEIMFKRKE